MKRNFRVIIKTKEDFTITPSVVTTDFEALINPFTAPKKQDELIKSMINAGILESGQEYFAEFNEEGNFRSSERCGRCIYIHQDKYLASAGVFEDETRVIELEEIPSGLEKVEINLKEAFSDIEDIQEEKILASNFMIVYIPFDELGGIEPVSLQEVEDLLDGCGFSQDYLDTYDKASGSHADYVKLVFREDGEDLKEDMKLHGGIDDYEEALRQERWF